MHKLLLIITLIAANLFAGETGKIRGKITDQTTGEPLFGVNIVLEGTNFGAASDMKGEYTINNISPGEYTVIISALGYQKKKFVNVKVNSDFTTRLDASLNSESIEIDEVVVEAQAPLVRKDLTSSQTTIDASTIENLPVESIGQLLVLQAGVTQGVGGDIHIRGGRSSEISYTVNGVPISNPFDNTATVRIATNAIQELSVISGTFNAEYGNAMSGIVNTVTKEGGMQYKGHVGFYTGDHLSSRKERFTHINDLKLTNNMVGELTLGGPVPLLPLTFFTSFRYDEDDGWLYGKRQQNIWDSIYINPFDPNDVRLASSGDGKIVPMNWHITRSGTFKLTYKPLPGMKISYDAIYSLGNSQGYNHSYKINPDGRVTFYDEGLLNVLELRHALDEKTFYSLKFSHNTNYYASYLFPLQDLFGNPVKFYPGDDLSQLKPSDGYQPEEKLTTPASYTFLFGGTQNGHNYEYAVTSIVKFDLASQINSNHEIKFGGEVKIHTLNFENFTIQRDTVRYLTPTILPTTNASHDYYVKKPTEFSIYAQDKMEYENIIVNIGLRYDYFSAKSVYSTNTFYPSPNDPDGFPSYIDPNSLLADAKGKHQISPRLGISFPITDKGIIHFSYGHFFQMPPFRFLYANSEFESNFSSGTPLFGNANLNPEKTVTYELGLQQQLMDDLAFNVTGFYKDVRDLLATQVVRIRGDKTYSKYVNKDYGSIKGITFTLTKRRTKSDLLGVTLDYTFQVAEGNDMNSDAFFLDLSSGRQTEKEVVFLPWDQSQTLNLTTSIGEMKNWNVSLIGRMGTGLPYTPQIIENLISIKTNSGRRPSTIVFDLFAEKSFDVMGFVVNIFAKIFNLFDTLNERVVYSDTGRSLYSLQQYQGGTKATEELSKRVPGINTVEEWFSRPDYFYPPREVQLGFSLEF